MLKVRDVFEYSDSFVMTMPLLKHGSLGTRIREKGPFPRDDVKVIVLQVLSALESLHNQLIVHRDIKI